MEEEDFDAPDDVVGSDLLEEDEFDEPESDDPLELELESELELELEESESFLSWRLLGPSADSFISRARLRVP